MIPRPIEFEEVRVGDEIRAERTRKNTTQMMSGTTVIVESQYITFEGNVSICCGTGWSLTLLSRPTEVRPVGSLWQDPETGTVWVRRDTESVSYGWVSSGGNHSPCLWSDYTNHAEIIERLVPWSPAGEQR